MRLQFFLLVVIFSSFYSFSQERFLQYNSKDSISEKPRIQGALGVNLKLNGYYDVFGGLQNSETFNIGSINVFGDNDEGSFKMDLHQTQIKLMSTLQTKTGEEIKAMVEFDFWGGNGRMRLRKAFVATDNWLVGQTNVIFGDSDLWPDIMEWEGPPSGVWVRAPQITYRNKFRNKKWSYDISINAPIQDYIQFGEVEPLLEEADQRVPDFTTALRYGEETWHVRLSSILRNIHYKYDGEKGKVFGYGFALSGKKTWANNSNWQMQLLAGQGIEAYSTSVQGNGYDGYPSVGGEFKASPTYGGWTSYEAYYSEKWHGTFVLGYSRFYSDDTERIIFGNEILSDATNLVNGNIDNWHYYGIANLMYDPIENMTIGLEMDYGEKRFDFGGYINGIYTNESRKRDAMRISFGIMYAF